MRFIERFAKPERNDSGKHDQGCVFIKFYTSSVLGNDGARVYRGRTELVFKFFGYWRDTGLTFLVRMPAFCAAKIDKIFKIWFAFKIDWGFTFIIQSEGKT